MNYAYLSKLYNEHFDVWSKLMLLTKEIASELNFEIINNKSDQFIIKIFGFEIVVDYAYTIAQSPQSFKSYISIGYRDRHNNDYTYYSKYTIDKMGNLDNAYDSSNPADLKSFYKNIFFKMISDQSETYFNLRIN